MAVGTVGEFLEVLERSKLLKPEEEAEVRTIAQESSDATTFAKTLVRQGKLTRWQAGQLLAGRGTFFLGKYKLIELLGRGGMGSVFLGEHVMMNRRVALKIIPRHIGKDPAGLERFLAEARTIASLDHPNIVQAYSVDNEGDLYYLVMEYVEGLDLQRLVEAEGPLDCASAVDYVRQAADGLTHAHAQKMVHCDIKPSNLIVNPNGVVKILDMGLTRLASPEKIGGVVSEQDERVLGTVDYMAPEQALQSADFNHRADIYSLGCTLYFLLTGHAPFPEGSLHERILKHQTKEPAAITAERSDVPLSLMEICKKMMAKKPADRYQTAAELSLILASWRPGEKQVQRVLQLKRAEPVDELPGPDLLGADLSDLFRKQIGAPVTYPIKIKKQPATLGQKIKAALYASVSTPQRKIAVIGITTLAALLVIAAVALFLGRNNQFARAGGISPVDLTDTSPSPQPSSTYTKKPDENKTPDNTDTTRIVNTAASLPEAPGPEAPTLAESQSKQPLQSDNHEATTTEPATESTNGESVATKFEQPQTPSPITDPFKYLPHYAALPEIAKADASGNANNNKPTLIGTVQMPAGATLQLILIGGDKTIKNADPIVMHNTDSEVKKPVWLISAQTASSDNADSPQRTEFAQLALDDGGKLQFTWLPNANAAHAVALRACGVLAVVKGMRQFVQLGRPRVVEPVSVDMDKGVSEVNIPLDSPATGNLYVQITDRGDNFPPNTLQPGDIIQVGDELKLTFLNPQLSGFELGITAVIAKAQQLDLKTTAFYVIPNQPQPKRTFQPSDALKSLKILLSQQDKAQKRFNMAPAGNPNKAALAINLKQLDEAVAFLQELNKLYQTLNKQGKIHYRVFNLYGNYKVELFTTKVPVVEPTEPPKIEKPVSKDAAAKKKQQQKKTKQKTP